MCDAAESGRAARSTAKRGGRGGRRAGEAMRRCAGDVGAWGGGGRVGVAIDGGRAAATPVCRGASLEFCAMLTNMCLYFLFVNSDHNSGLSSNRADRPTTIDCALPDRRRQSLQLGCDVTPRLIFNMKDAHADELLLVVGVLASSKSCRSARDVADLHDTISSVARSMASLAVQLKL